MSSAKNAISEFLGGSGQHKTDVDETINPAVTSETVKPSRHEETTKAIDREVHQDHYHTTVQPISHQETLPERHIHNVAPTQEREFHHGDSGPIQQRLQSEAAQFSDRSVTQDTQHSRTEAPTVTGEHVHHHVHETVQPIIHKETVQPEVVHTTAPVHEKHLAPSELHGLSTLPPKSLDDFKSSGGSLTGGNHHRSEYEGDPRPYNAELQSERRDVDKDFHAHDGYHNHNHGETTLNKESHGGTTSTGVGQAGTAAAGAGAGAAALKAVGTSDTTTGSASGHSHGHGTTGSSAPGASQTGASSHQSSAPHGQTTDTTHDKANPAALGAGVAGVGAGAAAQDLGRDHVRAGQNTDMSPRDTTSGQGTTGSTAAGTALGGRTEGNTVSGAVDHARNAGTGSHTSPAETASHAANDSHSGTASGTGAGAAVGAAAATTAGTSSHDTGDRNTRTLEPSDRQKEREPTNLSGPTAGTQQGKNFGDEAEVQHASKIGKDPALLAQKANKLTGEGTDGSHSAVFGLTPDGHKYDDTKHGSTPPKPAHSKDTSMSKPGGSGSHTPTSGGVADQLQDPRVAEKGHGGPAVSATTSEKPGAGSLQPAQGTGTVKPGENDSKPAF